MVTVSKSNMNIPQIFTFAHIQVIFFLNKNILNLSFFFWTLIKVF